MKNVINVYSEIAPLKRILLHRPGKEFLNLTPNTLNRLLFDDIPDLPVAQKEHDEFAKALRKEGVEVVYLVDLVAEALDTNINVREKFIKQFIKEGGVASPKIYKEVYALLDDIKDNKKLISKCIEGIDDSELKNIDTNKFYRTRDIGKMVLDPLPNLYAPRDPFACIGNGVSLHKMYSVTRSRETIFGEYIFKYHPKYKDIQLYYDRYDGYSIEGGDIQVLSDEVIFIGISQRTEPDAISNLAKKVLKSDHFKYIIAVDIPDERSFMHLDTVMTRVDVDKFAVHSHVMNVSDVYELSLKNGEVVIKEVSMPFDELLKYYLHLEHVTLIKCGGGNRIAAEREQWSDGVNTICVRPGVVITYSRNHVTNDALRKVGVKVIEVPSAELSRGRGGPHCMSMSLYREKE